MKSVLVAVILSIGIQSLNAQIKTDQADSLDRYLKFDSSPTLGILLPYLPPFFFQSGLELKSFIRSKTFGKIREQFGDIRAMDAIYIRAMELAYDNTAVALLISTVACFDHRLIGFKVPIFALFFPMTDESEKKFIKRIKNLPRKLYTDTPRNQAGDRDKLQHFFGSAFITNVFESRETANRFSEFIEKGEEAIIIGGTNDDRDRRANQQGQKFGMALLENNHRLPSEFFKSSNSSSDPYVNINSVKASGDK